MDDLKDASMAQAGLATDCAEGVAVLMSATDGVVEVNLGLFPPRPKASDVRQGSFRHDSSRLGARR